MTSLAWCTCHAKLNSLLHFTSIPRRQHFHCRQKLLMIYRLQRLQSRPCRPHRHLHPYLAKANGYEVMMMTLTMMNLVIMSVKMHRQIQNVSPQSMCYQCKIFDSDGGNSQTSPSTKGPCNRSQC